MRRTRLPGARVRAAAAGYGSRSAPDLYAASRAGPVSAQSRRRFREARSAAAHCQGSSVTRADAPAHSPLDKRPLLRPTSEPCCSLRRTASQIQISPSTTRRAWRSLTASSTSSAAPSVRW
eukprot:scaffold3473_cov122-Isochrysis_galbana.AAC.4